MPHLPPARAARGSGTGVGAVVVLVLLGALTLAAVGLVGFMIGPVALPGATVLALVPLVGVLAVVLWVDRWEPEPRVALAVAFTWGASVSVLVALVLNTGAQAALLTAGLDELRAGAVTATVVAPLVEESVKALGVLIIFGVWRRFFDSPVDGVVYAATVAAGFAFVENVLYFGQALGESVVAGDGGSTVATVFVMRAVLSPFAHLLFTSAVGLALGLAARGPRGSWLLALPLGLLVAVLLHALWNGSATLSTQSGFLGVYVAVQVPIFLGAVGIVVWLRHRESRVVQARLADYARAGWFAPQEVHMLVSLGRRRAARSWAGRLGGPGGRRAMRRFQTAASRAAYARQRVLRGRGDVSTWADEAALLADVGRARDDLGRRLALGRAV